MRKIMKLTNLLPLALCACFFACDSGSKPTSVDPEDPEEQNEQAKVVSVDYSMGRAMNKRLGKGINLGNAWDAASYWTCGTLYDAYVNGDEAYMPLVAADSSDYRDLPFKRYNYGCNDRLDSGWSNPISDSYFKLVKDAGFNSVRIPVRWQHNSNPETHEASPDRIAGVKEDVKLAIEAGLAVVVSFHWYYELMFAANHAETNPELFAEEKEHFASIWKQVAREFDSFPDTMLVWDILNEPTIKNASIMNEVMTLGYESIRSVTKKTIMFESYHAAKFADITALKLPEDGNIIYSGHYYEPYGYSHQGHGYTCRGDDAYAMTASSDFKSYVAVAQKLYPDKNGGHVPMNMGEFGVTSKAGSCGDKGPTDKYRSMWTQEVIKTAEKYYISWHYLGLAGVGGFDAYEK